MKIYTYKYKSHCRPFHICSSGKCEGISRKDELFNDLLEEGRSRDITFPRVNLGSDGQYILQVQLRRIYIQMS